MRGGFRQWHEFRGRDVAEHRMAPAQQRLGAGRPAAGHVVFRLEVQVELVLRLDGVGEMREQQEAALMRRVGLAVVACPVPPGVPAVPRGGEPGAKHEGGVGIVAIGHAERYIRRDGNAPADERLVELVVDLVQQVRQHAEGHDEGEAENADVVDLDGRVHRLAQPRGSGAHEILRMFMPDGAEQFVELRGAGQSEHDQLRPRLGPVACREFFAVRQPGNRVQPSHGRMHALMIHAVFSTKSPSA